MKKFKMTWTPGNWASRTPLGFGDQRPNNYWELIRAAIENRDQLPFAWRILTQGVCDGCALGTTGMRDWTLDGVHLCNIRLRLLRLNTMPAMDSQLLGDVEKLRGLSSAQLRDLGRIPYPMIRRKGEPGFNRVSWDDALDVIADKIRSTTPDRLGFYITSRGIPNEVYYATQKAVRAMGSSNIDNAARICHSPSTTALRAGLGVAASTCSYKDWLETDLLVFIGSNVANNQPVATKYIHFAKKNGAQVAVINSYREPGMERYWIPSLLESSLFGTRIADRFFLINQGGDIAFLSGVLKQLIELNGIVESFVAKHTDGFDALRSSLDRVTLEQLENNSGSSRDEMLAFARMIAGAKRAIFVWSMGITQHECGVDNVSAIVNLALSRGYVGRDGCGLMPIRGHSGVQGGAEMGCYATAFPGGLAVNAENASRLRETWGFDVPDRVGITAPEMIDAAYANSTSGAEKPRGMDVLFSVGGNFLEVLPDPEGVRNALANVPLRVHMDIVVSSQMLVDPGETVVLLPAATRYETPGGVTETSTERRIIYSPEIAGRRIGEARPESEVFYDLAKKVRPDLAHLFDAKSGELQQSIRNEIARVVPAYDGIQNLKKAGDEFQYGGRHLCNGWNFPTPDGKAHFRIPEIASNALPEGMFRLATRRGKQFNSMVHEQRDSITGAGRDAVLISLTDADKLGLSDRDDVVLRNEHGELRGRIQIAPIRPGNLQVHWPEGNVLIDRKRRARNAGVPDYNAAVKLEKL